MNKKKENIIKAISLSLPIAVLSTSAVGLIVMENKQKNVKNNLVLNSKKVDLKHKDIYNNKPAPFGQSPLNPDTIINIDRNKGPITISEVQTVYVKLKGYKGVPEVNTFLNTYKATSLIQNYNKPAFIQKLREIIKKIDHIGENQTNWFTLKTPSKSSNFFGTNISNVNAFTPNIATFKSSSNNIFKLEISSGNAGMTINGSSKLTLFMRNDNGQFANKTIKELVDNKDIFIRDLNQTEAFQTVKGTDLFEFKKENGEIKVYFKMKQGDKIQFKASGGSIKAGYLNEDEKRGVNNRSALLTNPSPTKIGIYSIGGKYKDNKVSVSLVKGKGSKVVLPVYYNKNKNQEPIKIEYEKSKYSISPSGGLKVEKGIINPKNAGTTPPHDDIKIEVDEGNNSAYFKINYGSKGDKQGSMRIDGVIDLALANIGAKLEDKVFFENIVKKPTKTSSKTIKFTSYNDANKTAKRFLTKTFAQWIQLKGYETKLNGQDSKNVVGLYNVSHSKYKNIKIADKQTKYTNKSGVELIKIVQKAHSEISDILDHTGNSKLKDKFQIFEPKSTFGQLYIDMESWLYSFWDKSDVKIDEFTNFINAKIKDKSFKTAKVQAELTKKAEQYLEQMVQKRVDDMYNNFKMIMLGKVYKYFGESLKIDATSNDKIIPKDIFTQVDVNAKTKGSIKVIKKKHVSLVNILDKTAAPDKVKAHKDHYLQQILDRIFDVIDKNGFSKFLLSNTSKFKDNKNKITKESTYISGTNGKKIEYRNARTSFEVIADLFKHFGISLNDIIEYSTSSKIDANKIHGMFKEKIQELQKKFIEQKRKINFYGKTFTVNRLDSLVIASNTERTFEVLKSKEKKGSKRLEKIEKVLKSDLSTDESINKFAISLKKYIISDYVTGYSNNPEQHVKDLINIDLKNMDYDLSKPLTPGKFGKILNYSKETAGAMLAIFGMVFAIISAIAIFMIKNNGQYSYNKQSVENVFDSNNQAKMTRKNKIIKISFACLLIIGIAMLVAGTLIATGVIAPVLFMI